MRTAKTRIAYTEKLATGENTVEHAQDNEISETGPSTDDPSAVYQDSGYHR